MRKIYRTIDEVLSAGIAEKLGADGTAKLDRVLKSTRLEDKLYAGLRSGDAELDAIEKECAAKLPTFPSLSRDIYQSFYSLSVRRNGIEELSDTARQFNSHILGTVMAGEEYPAIKSACEGRQLPAYDAAAEFVSKVSSELDGLLKEAGGDKGALGTLEKLAGQEKRLMEELDSLIRKRDGEKPDAGLEQKIIDKANRTANKSRQVEAVGRQVRGNMVKNQGAIGSIVAQAAKAAAGRAEETAQALAAWGAGGGDASPEQMKLDREIVGRVRKSPALAEVARHLGRFKEMAARARRNGYAHGRGEKYALELGNDLRRTLTSEYSLLAAPATIPLFLRKYQGKRLKQYRRREPVYRGCGDMIVCLDESTSAKGDAPWGKAVALALLDAAMAGGRKFALVHFSSRSKTDLFLPGGYCTSDVLAAAETFLGGGTDFEAPLREALRLIECGGFESADIIFATDGECSLPDGFQEELRQKQAAHGFKVTGVLMDIESPGMDFSLKPFCAEIYRASEIARDSIVETILISRV